MARSFRPSRGHHSHPPPHSPWACLSRSLPEGTAQTQCWHHGLRSPQSPFSACSTWKTSDSWWPDDSFLPSTSQTASAGTGPWGGEGHAQLPDLPPKAQQSALRSTGLFTPNPILPPYPQGQELAGSPEGHQQEHPQTGGMGQAGSRKGPPGTPIKGRHRGLQSEWQVEAVWW